MSEQRNFFKGTVLACTVMLLLAGCASQQKPVPDKGAAQAVHCRAAASGEALVGNWLAVRKQSGVAGELHVLFTLKPDGTMTYVEQLKRGKRPPQILSETGCWQREGQQLVLQTTQSNGLAVEVADPIYRNQYQVQSLSASKLGLKAPDGAMTARRMPDGYRLSVL